MNLTTDEDPTHKFTLSLFQKRISIFFCILSLFIASRSLLWAQTEPKIVNESNTIETVTFESLKSTINQHANNTATIKTQQEQERVRNQIIERMEQIISNYGGHMSGLADNLYDNAVACGGNPVLLFAIAGNESGFGRIPYKLYNPFGYLDGRQYSGWEESINYLSCKISTQHLAPCGNEVNCVIRRYGGSDTDREKWVKNINWFMSLI
jgi:hypothetical protein